MPDGIGVQLHLIWEPQVDFVQLDLNNRLEDESELVSFLPESNLDIREVLEEMSDVGLAFEIVFATGFDTQPEKQTATLATVKKMI
jgi:hypothetical protein